MDGIDVVGKAMAEVIALLKGPPESVVSLTIENSTTAETGQEPVSAAAQSQKMDGSLDPEHLPQAQQTPMTAESVSMPLTKELGACSHRSPLASLCSSKGSPTSPVTFSAVALDRGTEGGERLKGWEVLSEVDEEEEKELDLSGSCKIPDAMPSPHTKALKQCARRVPKGILRSSKVISTPSSCPTSIARGVRHRDAVPKKGWEMAISPETEGGSRVSDAGKHVTIIVTRRGTGDGPVGIGLLLARSSAGVFFVTNTFPGSPAAELMESGDLCVGDRVHTVDGRFVVGLTTEEVIQRIKGQAGTHVLLTLTRSGDEDLARLQAAAEDGKIMSMPQSVGNVHRTVKREIVPIRRDASGSNLDISQGQVVSARSRSC